MAIVALLTFALIGAAPGTYLDELSANPQISSDLLSRMRGTYGLDQPFYRQFWRVGTRRACAATSVTRSPITGLIRQLVGERVWNTFLLNGVALAAAWILGVALGLCRGGASRLVHRLGDWRRHGDIDVDTDGDPGGPVACRRSANRSADRRPLCPGSERPELRGPNDGSRAASSTAGRRGHRRLASRNRTTYARRGRHRSSRAAHVGGAGARNRPRATPSGPRISRVAQSSQQPVRVLLYRRWSADRFSSRSSCRGRASAS